LNPALEEFVQAVAATPPEAYYDLGKKEYLVQDATGEWMGFTESQFKRVLKEYGISPKLGSGQTLSPQDLEIRNLQHKRNVHFAGPLAGYRRGYLEDKATRMLVTSSPIMIEPVAGDWRYLEGLINGLLGEDGGVQLPYFHGWVKVSFETLRAGERRPGQVLALCGPHNCGKSLLQNLMTEILGGRAAKPYQFMSGGTSFNADLFGAEHLQIEDEQGSTDIRTRREFGAQIKNITVNEVQRLHGKHRDALPLKPFWRLTLSVNDELENLMVLPPIDDSLEDKLIILKGVRVPMPMPSDTQEQRKAFWARLLADLPGYLEWLTRWEIPAELRCPRFGIRHFHHPQIVGPLNMAAPEARLLSLIDGALFPEAAGLMAGMVKKQEKIEGTAEEIERMLTGIASLCAFEARKLLPWSGACGTYLGRLAKKQPERVESIRSATERRWILLPPPGKPANNDTVSPCLIYPEIKNIHIESIEGTPITGCREIGVTASQVPAGMGVTVAQCSPEGVTASLPAESGSVVDKSHPEGVMASCTADAGVAQ
jgi:hypothetical protein